LGALVRTAYLASREKKPPPRRKPQIRLKMQNKLITT
jgi:hypothetical protein